MCAVSKSSSSSSVWLSKGLVGTIVLVKGVVHDHRRSHEGWLG